MMVLGIEGPVGQPADRKTDQQTRNGEPTHARINGDNDGTAYAHRGADND